MQQITRCMAYRILTVGIDAGLLSSRQALLTSRGHDSLIATPRDVDEKLQSGKFDLVILSVMLSPDEKYTGDITLLRALTSDAKNI